MSPSGVLWRALVGSIALHVLAFGMLLPPSGGDGGQLPPDRVLQGHLVLPVLPEQVPPQVPPVPLAGPHAAHPPPVVAASTRTPAGIAVRRAEPAHAVPPASTFEPLPQDRPDTDTEAGGVPVAQENPAPATVAMLEQPAATGPDAAGLRQFRLALAGEARRFRRYPDAARREGLAGTAEIRIAVAAGGTDRQAELARSSGHTVLDVAALEMLRQAAARTQLPESLRSQRFAVMLPVVFAVED